MLSYYYLSKMGIECWSLRKTTIQPSFSILQLLKFNQNIGFLLLDVDIEQLKKGHRIRLIIQEILKALGLKLGDIAMPSVDASFQNNQLLITMGKIDFEQIGASLLSSNVISLSLTPSELLANPLTKKQIWMELKNFYPFLWADLLPKDCVTNQPPG
jgi:hypothetical protein